MRKIRYWLVLLVAALTCTGMHAQLLTAAQILDKAASQIKKAGSVSCTFNMKNGSNNVTGSLKCSGNKFVLSSPIGSAWYNGVYMWSRNPQTMETTKVKPTSQELLETNPMLYLNSYGKDFKATMAPKQKKGYDHIILTPIKNNNPLTEVEVILNTSNNYPVKFVVHSKQGAVTDIDVYNLTYKGHFPESTFVYPESKYPEYEVVEL